VDSVVNRALAVVDYRDLLKNLVVRDLKVRYRNSVLGFVWSLLNPLLMMVVFTFVFTTLMPQGNFPDFPVFLLAALLPWNWCAAAVMGGTGSLVGNAHLITKVYFPRELLPISVVLSSMINYLLALPVLFGMIALIHPGYETSLGLRPILGPSLLWLPLVIVTQFIFLSGLALFLSALNVFFRDTEVIMDVLVTAWFFLTPVVYRLENLAKSTEVIDWMYRLNPMAALIGAYRKILYFGEFGSIQDIGGLLRTLATASAVLILGYLFFMRFSRQFGEEL
jgi:ABC-type polysaccharide/polyol phosphate export permease